jgi:membrane associated rhomboid family serine protease
MALGTLLEAFDQVKSFVPDILKGFAILWLVNMVNWWIFRRALFIFGIFPRRLIGVPGILLAPIWHGDFNHLLFNSIPAFVLICFMLLLGLPTFLLVTGMIVIGSGFLIWLFGRPGLHIGMSAVITGYFGFLLINAYEHPSLLSVLPAVVMVYYFGSIFLSIFPQEERVSWEGHLYGMIIGVLTNFTYLYVAGWAFSWR